MTYIKRIDDMTQINESASRDHISVETVEDLFQELQKIPSDEREKMNIGFTNNWSNGKYYRVHYFDLHSYDIVFYPK